MANSGFVSKYKQQLGIGLIVFIVVIVVAIIPVVIVTTTPKNKSTTTSPTTSLSSTTLPATTPATTKKPYNPSVLTDEQKSRINCFLEEESRFEKLTKYQCEVVRGCIYEPSDYERVPFCFYDRKKLGYELVKQSVNDKNTEVYDLKRSNLVKAPYLEEIKNLKLKVEYLGENVVHVKVQLYFDNI